MTPIERLVDFFGGQTKTALALGVSQAAVSYWVSGIHLMSAEKAFKAEELTAGQITARELCSRPQAARKSAALTTPRMGSSPFELLKQVSRE